MTAATTTTGNGAKERKARTPVPADETKRERFRRLVNSRTNKALKAISTIALMGSNKSSYDWGEADIDRVRSALTNAVNEMALKMRRNAKQLPLFDVEGTGEVE